MNQSFADGNYPVFNIVDLPTLGWNLFDLEISYIKKHKDTLLNSVCKNGIIVNSNLFYLFDKNERLAYLSIFYQQIQEELRGLKYRFTSESLIENGFENYTPGYVYMELTMEDIIELSQMEPYSRPTPKTNKSKTHDPLSYFSLNKDHMLTGAIATMLAKE